MAHHIVTMRELSDCEAASLATAAGVSYEQAKRAIGKTPMLPEGVNDPLFGNPANMRGAIERLGFKAIRRTMTDILNGTATPGKTVVLLVAGTLAQHWVVLSARNDNFVWFHWGDGSQPCFTHDAFRKYFGKTNMVQFKFNAAWEVGPNENRGGVSRVQQLLNWFKNLFRKR